jgi:fumarate hydratase class II
VFTPAVNKFEALASNDTMLEVSGALQCLSASLHKIANDIRLLGSGPRCGLGELLLPENEPGSSIMPGKVNPTQCESMTMVCAHVHGLHAGVAFAASMGHFELNTYKPVIGFNVLTTIRLLGDSCVSFAEKCIDGLAVDRARVKELLDRSLMQVTILNPVIGYASAAQVAKKAYKEKKSLKEATVELGFLSASEFEQLVRPEKMI